jgi:hypothetical protein
MFEFRNIREIFQQFSRGPMLLRPTVFLDVNLCLLPALCPLRFVFVHHESSIMHGYSLSQ